MPPATRHGNETLRRIGICVMVGGFVAAVLPALPAPAGAGASEQLDLIEKHLWWQYWGCAAYVVGNLLRLKGTQGHFGLPWPGRRGRIPHDLVARVILRRRAFENRARAQAGS
jgi:hypothetical protein